MKSNYITFVHNMDNALEEWFEIKLPFMYGNSQWEKDLAWINKNCNYKVTCDGQALYFKSKHDATAFALQKVW